MVPLSARVVTQTRLSSCRGVCVDRGPKVLVCFMAMGPNFSQPTAEGAAPELTATPPYHDPIP
jgi:hypothetical protein